MTIIYLLAAWYGWPSTTPYPYDPPLPAPAVWEMFPADGRKKKK
jgi:hypothetical protein